MSLLGSQSSFDYFLYLGREFFRSVVYGRRDEYRGLQSSAELSSIFSKDFAIFLYCALAVFVFSWATRLVVIEPFARAVLPKPTKKKVQKFAQASMESELRPRRKRNKNINGIPVAKLSLKN